MIGKGDLVGINQREDYRVIFQLDGKFVQIYTEVPGAFLFGFFGKFSRSHAVAFEEEFGEEELGEEAEFRDFEGVAALIEFQLSGFGGPVECNRRDQSRREHGCRRREVRCRPEAIDEWV